MHTQAHSRECAWGWRPGDQTAEALLSFIPSSICTCTQSSHHIQSVARRGQGRPALLTFRLHLTEATRSFPTPASSGWLCDPPHPTPPGRPLQEALFNCFPELPPHRIFGNLVHSQKQWDAAERGVRGRQEGGWRAQMASCGPTRTLQGSAGSCSHFSGEFKFAQHPFTQGPASPVTRGNRALCKTWVLVDGGICQTLVSSKHMLVPKVRDSGAGSALLGRRAGQPEAGSSVTDRRGGLCTSPGSSVGPAWGLQVRKPTHCPGVARLSLLWVSTTLRVGGPGEGGQEDIARRWRQVLQLDRVPCAMAAGVRSGWLPGLKNPVEF